MKHIGWRRRSFVALLAGGCLLAGPCGISSLQLRDFLTSLAIRTGVTTAASMVEASIAQNAANADGE